jgi:RHS repeat-associated protein
MRRASAVCAAENRISNGDNGVDVYTYNPLGNRVRNDTATGSTEYFVFGGNTISELNPATGAFADYIFGGGKRYAKDTSANGTGVQYYHSDHLGSTSIMTNTSGTKISDCTYAPYGEEVSCSPSNVSNHYKFTGKERDSETGHDYFGARYYGSNMGRFLSPDEFTGGPMDLYGPNPSDAGPLPYANIVNPQSLNKYSYTYNNPIRYVDPDGHETQSTLDDQAARSAGDGIAGAIKGLYNMAAGTWNAVAGLLNEQGQSSGQPYMQMPMAPTATYDNATQAVAGGVAQLATVAASAAKGLSGSASSEAGAAAKAPVLNEAQAANLGRFEGSLPKGAGPTTVNGLPNGGELFNRRCRAKCQDPKPSTKSKLVQMERPSTTRRRLMTPKAISCTRKLSTKIRWRKTNE